MVVVEVVLEYWAVYVNMLDVTDTPALPTTHAWPLVGSRYQFGSRVPEARARNQVFSLINHVLRKAVYSVRLHIVATRNPNTTSQDCVASR